jgi:N6-adenosine-specific RNA methylase IME4
MNPFAGLPRHHYQIILADPPWKFKVYNEATGSSRAASNHYDVMDTAAICRLPVKDFAARDAALSLWVTAPFLQIAFDVMAAWGFPYSTNAVWTKDRFGTGFWLRSQHELLLVGKHGSFVRQRPPIVRPL